MAIDIDIDIDIDRLIEAELINVNHRIVERLRLLSRAREEQVMPPNAGAHA